MYRFRIDRQVVLGSFDKEETDGCCSRCHRFGALDCLFGSAGVRGRSNGPISKNKEERMSAIGILAVVALVLVIIYLAQRV